jgi:hypothetical protein
MVLNCFCGVQSMYARGLQMQAEIELTECAKMTDGRVLRGWTVEEIIGEKEKERQQGPA